MTTIVERLRNQTRYNGADHVEEIVRLDLDDLSLFGIVFSPKEKPRDAFVICPSLLEFLALQKDEADLGRALARLGHLVVYVQPPGWGYSEGSPMDCTIDDRVRTAHLAVEEARRRTAVREVGLIGTALGALVAIEMCRLLEGSCRLVLIDPALDKASYLERGARFHQTAAIAKGANAKPFEEVLEKDGYVIFGAHPVSRRVIDDLGNLDHIVGRELMGDGPAFVAADPSSVERCQTLLGRRSVDVHELQDAKVIRFGLRQFNDELIGAVVEWAGAHE